MVELYRWAAIDKFQDRAADLARLEEWWEAEGNMPLNLYGRRRTGKSWLFRRLAHNKPAVILVADKLAPGTQLSRFAAALTAPLGFRPDLADVPTVFRLLFRLGQQAKTLVVIDEFPWLLPATEAEAQRVLSGVQAVIEEERDASQLKLILCGSSVSQMESLMSERNPLHGRFIAHALRPLRYQDASVFLANLDPLKRIERFSITGGMPRYLSDLAGGDLKKVICSELLNPHGCLWDEGRVIVEQELRQANFYFSILEQLATGAKTVEEISTGARIENKTVTRYLDTLVELRVVRRGVPVGAPETSRQGRWHLTDPFLGFWFRYVFPFQTDLESGLPPADLWTSVIAPTLSEHVAPHFEQVCRDWTATNCGARAQKFGSWWGNSLNAQRRIGERTSEEIDIVGLSKGKVTLVGECRWRNKAMDGNILRELFQYKLPALVQDGYRLADDLHILLFSRSGYMPGLTAASSTEPSVELIDVKAQVG